MSLKAVPTEFEWPYNEEVPLFDLLYSSEMFIFCGMVNLDNRAISFQVLPLQPFIHLEYASLVSGISCELFFIEPMCFGVIL